jgi:hypothetical protein
VGRSVLRRKCAVQIKWFWKERTRVEDRFQVFFAEVCSVNPSSSTQWLIVYENRRRRMTAPDTMGRSSAVRREDGRVRTNWEGPPDPCANVHPAQGRRICRVASLWSAMWPSLRGLTFGQTCVSFGVLRQTKRTGRRPCGALSASLRRPPCSFPSFWLGRVRRQPLRLAPPGSTCRR